MEKVEEKSRMTENMKICLVNSDTAWKNPQKNSEDMENLIQNALEIDSEIQTIVFPELNLTGFVIEEDNINLAEDSGGVLISFVKEIAQKYKINVLASFIEKNPKGKPFNSLVAIDKKGTLLATYHKNHLFTQSKEPQVYSRGTSLVVCKIDGWKCGLSICFDIRFPRLYETYKKAGVECVFVVANWLDGRNKPEIFDFMVKARAHENQFFVAAVNRSGKDPNASYTGSAVVANPYGEDISVTKSDIFHIATLNKDTISKIEKELPLKESFREKYAIENYE